MTEGHPWPAVHPSTNPDYVCGFPFGSPSEPESSLWCAALLGPVRETQLDEPFGVLDYGCGDGRLFEFLSRRCSDFDYYGIEQSNSHGEAAIGQARRWFGHDQRAAFDVAGSEVFRLGLKRSNVAVLGSVATHLHPAHFAPLLERLSPVLVGGGAIVASVFLRDTVEARGTSCYGNPDCWEWHSMTKEALSALASLIGASWRPAGRFEADGADTTHDIVVFEVP